MQPQPLDGIEVGAVRRQIHGREMMPAEAPGLVPAGIVQHEIKGAPLLRGMLCSQSIKKSLKDRRVAPVANERDARITGRLHSPDDVEPHVRPGLQIKRMAALARPCRARARIPLHATFVAEKHAGLRVAQQRLEPRQEVRALRVPPLIGRRQRPRTRDAQHPAVLVEMAHKGAVAQRGLQMPREVPVELDSRPVMLARGGRIFQQRNDLSAETLRRQQTGPAAAALVQQCVYPALIEGADPAQHVALRDIAKESDRRPRIAVSTSASEAFSKLGVATGRLKSHGN